MVDLEAEVARVDAGAGILAEGVAQLGGQCGLVGGDRRECLPRDGLSSCQGEFAPLRDGGSQG